ncbi:flagellar basal body-associated FliL family protein [Alphaproteobacteria bacterium]|jgi:flagellar FliL protein|nr:flagellar basal body-associated FliL family protein [Alphaproteobacteria bacterium]
MADNDTEAKASSGLVKKIAIYGGAGILLLGLGLGAGYMIFGAAQPDPSEQIEEIIERKMAEKEAEEAEDNTSMSKQAKDTPVEEVFETIYHEFPGTFTTNLSGSRRMLQIGVGVSTQYDDTVMMNVESHQLALRSIILGVISDFTEDDVRGAAGREKLATALRDALNLKLEALESFGGVEEVHFTSFVLQ